MPVINLTNKGRLEAWMKLIRISANFADMDLDVIHGFISASYWAKGIPMSTLKRSLEKLAMFWCVYPSG